MRFRIGQEVVSLVNTPNAVKGNIYTIFGIRDCVCRCSVYEYDLGFVSWSNADHHCVCESCGHEVTEKSSVDEWFYDHEIAPLLTDEQEADYEEAIQEREYATL